VQNISDILDHHASYILLDPYKRPTQFKNAQAVVNYIKSRNEIIPRADLSEEEKIDKLNKEKSNTIDLA